jgi:hypothetical protein
MSAIRSRSVRSFVLLSVVFVALGVIFPMTASAENDSALDGRTAQQANQSIDAPQQVGRIRSVEFPARCLRADTRTTVGLARCADDRDQRWRRI